MASPPLDVACFERDSDLATLLGTGPFHAALRAAIRDRGLPLQRLQWRLARLGIRIAVSSLSYWQTGRAVPTRHDSEAAVQALEEILRLPPGALVRLLEAARAAAGPGTNVAREGLDESAQALAVLFDTLPRWRPHQLEVISRHDKVSVDADGRLSAVQGRALVQARRDGVDRYVLSFDLGPGGDTRQVHVEPLQNCRRGAVRRHPVAPVIVAELLFDETLRAGDTWMFEYRMTDPDGPLCWEYARGIAHPISQYLLEVQFDPLAIPLDCHVYACTDLDSKAVRLRELTVNRHHAVHHVASDVNAGVLGIAWSWP
jgi:hypothetical protein